MHDDLEAAYRQLMRLTGDTGANAEAVAVRQRATQAAMLPIADLCTHVSLTEAQALASLNRQTAIVLPRPYVHEAFADANPEYDLLLVGDQHPFNLVSLAWFLQQVWQPLLSPAGIRVAIAGRAGGPVRAAVPPSSLLHVLGFVTDLEALRARCRVTVVPDCGGTGVAVKTLTTLYAGHPLATTTIGLRGLDPALTRLLPAFNDPTELAADILALCSNPENLAARRALVREVRDSLHRGPGYADCLAKLPAPTAAWQAQRLAQWQDAIAPAQRTAIAPYWFTLNAPFAMTGTIWDDQVLRYGWHEPEDWGRWMDGATSEIIIRLTEPSSIPLGLDLDLVPSPVEATLSIMIEDSTLATIQPVSGSNVVIVPLPLIEGTAEFVVSFHTSAAFCPADVSEVPDARILGVGFRGVRIVSRAGTVLSIDQPLRVSSRMLPWDLLLDGWHDCEGWGCWSKDRSAHLQINVAEPLQGLMELQLDLFPSAHDALLTLSVNGQELPQVQPADGLNCWPLPSTVTDGASRLVIGLEVSAMARAGETGSDADDRMLGIGLRSIRMVSREPTMVALDQKVPVIAGAVPWDLLLDNWHPPEEWGCWSDGKTAAFQIRLREAVAGPLALDLDVTTAMADAALTVAANGSVVSTTNVEPGLTRCLLPKDLAAGTDRFVVRLSVSDTLQEEAVALAKEGRILGIGLRGLRFTHLTPPAIQVGKTIPLERSLAPAHMLTAEWHEPEDWGCWTRATDATLALHFDPPLSGSFLLQLDTALPPVPQPLTPSVNGIALPPRVPVSGWNTWRIPRAVTQECESLVVGLHVPQTTNPAELGASTDDRHLGMGVRAFAIAKAHVTPIAPNRRYSITASPDADGILGEGWHAPESWGCWSAAPEAILYLTFDEPLADRHYLELSLARPLLGQPLTVSVNEVAVFEGLVKDGFQSWKLPESCTSGQMDLRITLAVDGLVCPSKIKESADSRHIGVGIRAVALFTPESGCGPRSPTLEIGPPR
ncbi:MAG: glycosyltransferase [Rhodopila sp.]